MKVFPILGNLRKIEAIYPTVSWGGLRGSWEGLKGSWEVGGLREDGKDKSVSFMVSRPLSLTSFIKVESYVSLTVIGQQLCR